MQQVMISDRAVSAIGSLDLLNEKDAAAEMDLAVSTLRNWRALGKGPKFIKVGQRLVRYRRSDLEAFIAGGEGGA